MLTPQIKPPKKRMNPNMMAEAADMAAEGVEAPVVPTSNMRLPYNRPQKVQQVQQPVKPAGMSGAPPSGGGGMMQGFGGMNVTGPGERQLQPGESQQDRLNRLRGGAPVGMTPDTIRDRVAKDFASEGKTPPQSSDQLYQDALEELLGSGPRDTAQEEADIRRQMESDVSAGQADLNARIAAGGGGTSGALGALSTDMRSRAALDAASAITGVRDNARDEYLRKLQLGMGGEMQDRAMDMDEAQFEMYMDMLEQMFGESEVSKEDARKAWLANHPEYNPNNAGSFTDQLAKQQAAKRKKS